MYPLASDDFPVSFSAKDFANECSVLLKNTDYTPAVHDWYESAFPEASWMSDPKKISNNRHTSFYVSRDDLKLDLDKFCSKFLKKPIISLRRKCGEGDLTLTKGPFELPEGVDFIATSDDGALRVIMVEHPVPSILRDPCFYPEGLLKRWFDIDKSCFFIQFLAPLFRIDVRVAA